MDVHVLCCMQGDWMCSGCEKGATLPNRQLRTACDKFLWGTHILAVSVCRVWAAWTSLPPLPQPCVCDQVLHAQLAQWFCHSLVAVPPQLGHVTAIVRNRCGDGRVEFACRYYLKPEDTHVGRQVRHRCPPGADLTGLGPARCT